MLITAYGKSTPPLENGLHFNILSADFADPLNRPCLFMDSMQ